MGFQVSLGADSFESGYNLSRGVSKSLVIIDWSKLIARISCIRFSLENSKRFKGKTFRSSCLQKFHNFKIFWPGEFITEWFKCNTLFCKYLSLIVWLFKEPTFKFNRWFCGTIRAPFALLTPAVILGTEGSIQKIQKNGTSSLKKVKKGTLNLTSPYVDSLFITVLTKQIFEKLSYQGQCLEVGLSFSLK